MQGDTVVLFGWTNSTDGDLFGLGVSDRDGWVVKLGPDGSLLSSKVYGTSLYEAFQAGAVTSTGDLIAAGIARNIPVDIGYHHGDNDLWLVKMDNNGNVKWQGLYGGSKSEVPIYDCIKEAPFNGGYYIGTLSFSNDGDVTGHHASSVKSDMWIVKIDTSGQLLWQRSIGGSEEDYPTSLNFDGFLSISGLTHSADGDFASLSGQYAGAIIKLNDFTSIEVIQPLHGVATYPNPSTGQVTFDLKNLRAIDNIRLEVFSVNAQLVHSTILLNAVQDIELNVPAGIYHYRLVHGNGQAIRYGNLIIQ